MVPIRTRELFWARSLGHDDQAVVAWAQAECEAGTVTPNLAALATLKSPYNHFEVESLFARALTELGIAEPDPNLSFLDFLRETCSSILEGRTSPTAGCTTLARAHGGDITRGELEPFWLLDMGAQDLKETGVQFYYRNLSLENFDDMVVHEAHAVIERIGRPS